MKTILPPAPSAFLLPVPGGLCAATSNDTLYLFTIYVIISSISPEVIMGNLFQKGSRLGDYFLGQRKFKPTFLDEIDNIID